MVDILVNFVFCLASAVVGFLIARRWYRDALNNSMWQLAQALADMADLEDELTELKVELDTYDD